MNVLPTLMTCAALIAGAELLTVLAAGRDADAARRFREMGAHVVNGVADKRRNRRWHVAGAGQRAAEGLLLAVGVVAVAGRPWAHVAAAWAVAGGWTWRRFDYAFARRFGQPAGYLGGTSSIDRLRTDAAWLGSKALRRLGAGLVIAGAAVLAWLS